MSSGTSSSVSKEASRAYTPSNSSLRPSLSLSDSSMEPRSRSFVKMPSAGGHVPRITDAPASASDLAIAKPYPASSATPATKARRPERSMLSIILSVVAITGRARDGNSIPRNEQGFEGSPSDPQPRRPVPRPSMGRFVWQSLLCSPEIEVDLLPHPQPPLPRRGGFILIGFPLKRL